MRSECQSEISCIDAKSIIKMNDTEKCEWCNTESLGSIHSLPGSWSIPFAAWTNRTFTDLENV